MVAGGEAVLSGFLTGTAVFDPFAGIQRSFDDLGRRANDLKRLVCPRRPHRGRGQGGRRLVRRPAARESTGIGGRVGTGGRAGGTGGTTGAEGTGVTTLERGIARVHQPGGCTRGEPSPGTAQIRPMEGPVGRRGACAEASGRVHLPPNVRPGCPQHRHHRPRRPRKDDARRRLPAPGGSVPHRRGDRRLRDGLERSRARARHHHPLQVHGHHLEGDAHQHRRHARPRRLRRRGRARAQDGRLGLPARRRVRGADAADAVRDPQGARARAAGRSWSSTRSIASAAIRRGRSTRPSICSARWARRTRSSTSRSSTRRGARAGRSRISRTSARTSGRCSI